MKLILFAVPSLTSDEEITEALISVSQKLGNSLSAKIIEQNELFPRNDSEKFKEILRNLTNVCNIPSNCNQLQLISNFWVNLANKKPGFERQIIKFVADNSDANKDFLKSWNKLEIISELCKKANAEM